MIPPPTSASRSTISNSASTARVAAPLRLGALRDALGPHLQRREPRPRSSGRGGRLVHQASAGNDRTRRRDSHPV